MLHIEVLPVGVQRVTITGDTPAEQDLALIVWPYLRRYVDSMDAALRRELPGILERLRQAESRQRTA